MKVSANFNKKDKKNLLKSLSKIAQDDDLSSPFRKVAQTIRFEVEGRIPKDTRELVKSWEYEQKSDKEAGVGFTAEYAAYQHEGQRKDGSHKIKNRPADGESFYLTNAIENKKDDIKTIIGKFYQTKIFKSE